MALLSDVIYIYSNLINHNNTHPNNLSPINKPGMTVCKPICHLNLWYGVLNQ